MPLHPPPVSGAPAPLAGRTAVVTGAGRGTGAAIARHLAAAGASVVLAARSAHEIDAVAAELRESGTHAAAIVCNVADAASVERLASAARQAAGPIHILVNNAGIASAAPLIRTSLDDWNAALAVNATGAFLCLKAFLPAMLDAGWGRVINIASTAALSGDRFVAAYCASKHALLGLTRAAAAEAAAHGVTVNAICPGFLATDMTEQSITRIAAATGRSRDDAADILAQRNPQRRLIDPAEVAAAAVYLCGESARGVNGAALVIDGGELRR